MRKSRRRSNARSPKSRARTEIGDLRDKFEDERAAGSTLAEAAKKLGLKSRTIDAVDRSGRGPDGKPIADLPKTPDVVAAAFASDVGVDNDPLQLPDGGYLWYDVAGITPARDRTLDEVKDQVEARWRDDEIAKRLKAKTDDMVGKLKSRHRAGASSRPKPASRWRRAADLQRGKPGGFAPAKLVEAVFQTPKDVPAAPKATAETERFVFRVTDVIDPDARPASPQGKRSPTTLQNSYCRRHHRRLCRAARKRFRRHASTRPALDQVIGGGAQQ